MEDLITVLLRKTPQERPSAKQLLHVPAMRPYVENYVSYGHKRGSSEASQDGQSPLKIQKLDDSPKETPLPRRAPITLGDASRCKSQRVVVSGRSAAMATAADQHRCFSEGYTPLVIRKKVHAPRKKSCVYETERGIFLSRRCSEKTKAKESGPQEYPEVFSPGPGDAGIEIPRLEHPTVWRLRGASSRRREGTRNAPISSVSFPLETKRMDRAPSHHRRPERNAVSRDVCVDAQTSRRAPVFSPNGKTDYRTTEANLGRKRNQPQLAGKYNCASANKENVSL